MEEYADAIGLVAGIITTAAFLPQIYRIWKNKCGKDVSYRSYLAFTLGTIAWLLYGMAAHSLPVLITNALNLALNVWVLLLKYWYENRAVWGNTK